MKHLSFAQWKIRNFDLVQAQVKCPECNGSGITLCDHCGSSGECSVCDGKKKVIVLNNGDTVQLSTLYHLQLARDKKIIKSIDEGSPTFPSGIEKLLAVSK